MNLRRSKSLKSSRGQSLVETALMLPLMIMLVLNVVNLGYFFLVVINLTGAARTATLYAIEGGATPISASGLGLPSAGGSNPGTNTTSITYLTFQDLTGAVWNPTGVTVQVCSEKNLNASQAGVNTNTGAVVRTNCETCTSSGCSAAGNGTPVPDVDPEAGTAASPAGRHLNQVRITYTFNALIPGQIFNIPLQAFSGICNSGSCTFTRQAEMRAMN